MNISAFILTLVPMLVSTRARNIEAEALTFEIKNRPEIKYIPFDDILCQTVDIRILDCSLRDISSFPARFSQLVSLNLANNRLTRFPDLSNVSGSLEILDLSDNDIEQIQLSRLLNLTRLRNLNLVGNTDLESFPDCTSPTGLGLRSLKLPGQSLDCFPLLPCFGSLLESLDVIGGTFRAVSRDCFSWLTHLRVLRITDTPLLEPPPVASIPNNTLRELVLDGTAITGLDLVDVLSGSLDILSLSRCPDVETLPRLCPYLASGSVLKIRDLDLVCDCRLRWLWIAAHTGHVTLDMKGAVCRAPTQLKGRQLSSLSLGELTGTDDMASHWRLFTRNHDNTCGTPSGLMVYHNKSRSACAVICFQTPGCWSFSFKSRAEVEGDSVCGVTSAAVSPSSDQPLQFDTWYTM